MLAVQPLSTLHQPHVQLVLRQLHRAARKDAFLHLPGVLLDVADLLRRRTPSVEEQVRRLRHAYVPLSPAQGQLVYLLARVCRARRIVEFGTSFGISTIYLACAVKDNVADTNCGEGTVIGSEMDEEKRSSAEQNLRRAGLEGFVSIRGGDARQSLSDPGGPVDFLLLDGAKTLYLPILRQLTPYLRNGAVVVSDNTRSHRRQLTDFLRLVRTGGFESVSLPFESGTELSIYSCV